MDDYPEDLAPERDNGGGIITPFGEWWPRVRDRFPTVPDDVAKQWLHRHWGHSPFGFLRSRDYSFSLEVLASGVLAELRVRNANYVDDPTPHREHGAWLVEVHHRRAHLWLVDYMLKSRDFPAPIIVLDNRDGHFVGGAPGVPTHEGMPPGLVLIEGHRRFEIGLYLHSIGRLSPTVGIWQMLRRNPVAPSQ